MNIIVNKRVLYKMMSLIHKNLNKIRKIISLKIKKFDLKFLNY
jgi:hypothetical protein